MTMTTAQKYLNGLVDKLKKSHGQCKDTTEANKLPKMNVVLTSALKGLDGCDTRIDRNLCQLIDHIVSDVDETTPRLTALLCGVQIATLLVSHANFQKG